MRELPGMWDESDLRGGETDCADDLLIVRKLKEENAVLKEENERLKAEKVQINGKLAGSRLVVSRLEARVAELEEASTQLESLQKDLEEVKRTASRYEAQIDAQSEEIIELRGRLRAPQSHNITTELSEILRREVGYGCLDSCIQKAQSWDAVSALLDELYSGWKTNPGTRKDAALAAIKDLADQASQKQTKTRVPDVSALMEALEMMLQMVEMGGFGKDAAMETARARLAASKGGEV